MIFRPALIPSLFLISTFITSIYLGIWQADRMIWKQALIDNLHNKWTNVPQDLPQALGNQTMAGAAPLSKLVETYEFTPLILKGEFLTSPLYFRPTSYHKRNLLEVIAPFKTENMIIPVALGLILTQDREHFTPPKMSQSLTAMVRFSKNNPQNKILKSGSLIAQTPMHSFGAHLGPQSVAPFWANAVHPTQYLPTEKVIIKKKQDFLDNIPNNHFYYMLQWYFFAMISAITYFAWHIHDGRLYRKKI